MMRDISFNGRVLLSKAEGISHSVYTSSLEMPKDISKNWIKSYLTLYANIRPIT